MLVELFKGFSIHSLMAAMIALGIFCPFRGSEKFLVPLFWSVPCRSSDIDFVDVGFTLVRGPLACGVL